MYDFAAHIKATLNGLCDLSLPSLRVVVTEDDMNRFNVPFDHFSQFIQQVDAPEIVQKVIVLRDENAFEELELWKEEMFSANETDYPVLMNFQQGKITNELKNYEEKEKLHLLNKHEDFFPFPWSIVHYYKVVKKQGFYTEDAGYQGGIISETFKNWFDNKQLNSFALKEDFRFVYECIDATPPYDSWEDIDARRRNFKENFLDNFVLGTSYLWLE